MDVGELTEEGLMTDTLLFVDGLATLELFAGLATLLFAGLATLLFVGLATLLFPPTGRET